MSKIFAVFKRELALYFRSPIAYAIAFALFLFFGLLYSDRLTQFNQQFPADGVNIVPNLLTFLLFLVWIFFASYASGGAQAAGYALAFMLLLFACVVAHEFGHIFMARRFGVTTPTVTLLPIGGVA